MLPQSYTNVLSAYLLNIFSKILFYFIISPTRGIRPGYCTDLKLLSMTFGDEWRAICGLLRYPLPSSLLGLNVSFQASPHTHTHTHTHKIMCCFTWGRVSSSTSTRKKGVFQGLLLQSLLVSNCRWGEEAIRAQNQNYNKNETFV